MKVKLAIVVLILVILLTSCGGQGVYGNITDGETGKPVSGALVELDCTNCDASFTTKTDVAGNYNFPDVTAGNYFLNIVWSDPPDCPGITPFETLGTSGDFIVTYVGYGGLGGFGNKGIMAVTEFQLEEGQGKKYNLDIACPE